MAKQTKRKSRTAPCGLRHEMQPFFMGLAVAEFLPADPAIWLDAAIAARVSFGCHNGKVVCDTQTKVADAAARDFIVGWLAGTPGAGEAVHDLLQSRGVQHSLR